jgi:hypothetical protein
LQKPPLEVNKSEQKLELVGNMEVVKMTQKLYHSFVEG